MVKLGEGKWLRRMSALIRARIRVALWVRSNSSCIPAWGNVPGEQHSPMMWWGRLWGSLQGWSQERLGKNRSTLVCSQSSTAVPWWLLARLGADPLTHSNLVSFCFLWPSLTPQSRKGLNCFSAERWERMALIVCISFVRRLTMGCGHFFFSLEKGSWLSA